MRLSSVLPLRPVLLATAITLPLALGALAQAEADRQLDAAIARLKAALGPDSEVTWRDRRVDPVTGVARLDGLAIRRGRERLTAESVELGGLDGPRIGSATFAAIRMEEAPAAGAPGPIVLRAGRIVLTGLTVPSPAGGAEGSVDWAAAALEGGTAEGLRMENPGKGEAELGRLTVAGYAPGTLREAVLEGFRFNDRQDGEVRIQLGRARLAGATVPRPGQRFDPWALAAEEALVEGAELGSSKQEVVIRLGRTRLQQWGSGRLTTFLAEGLAIATPAGAAGKVDVSLGRLSFSGIAARDTAHAWATDVVPPSNRPGQEQLLEAEGLGVTREGQPLLELARARARNAWDPASPTTEAGSVELEGIAVDLPPDLGGSWLEGIGLKRILGVAGIDSRYARAEGRLVTDPFVVHAQGLGKLGLAMDLRGVQMPAAGARGPAPEDAMGLVAGWSIASFGLRYADEGLARGLVAQQAAREGIPEARYRERNAQMALGMPVPGAPGGKEALEVTRIRQAVASFARDLGTIEITMRPAVPVPMMEFVTFAGLPPEQAVRKLNLVVTATPPGR